MTSDTRSENEFDLSGQVAVVTGGGRGFGRHYALALAKAGASVAVLARTEAQLRETVQMIEGQGGNAVAVSLDVTDQSSVEAAMATVVEQLGSIDLLVNNAGVGGPSGPTWEVEPDQWWRTVEINLRGPFLCARSVLPGMITRGGGRIINVTSGSGLRPMPPYLAHYCASKAALTHWTNCLDIETREHGISVFAYSPGLLITAANEFYLKESADVHPATRQWFLDGIAQGNEIPVEQSVRGMLVLASGRVDALSGRYFSARDDLEDLIKRQEEIIGNDSHTQRLRV